MSKMTTIETVDKALAPGVASRELQRRKPEPRISLKSRRGALTLALLLLVQFLDFLDVSIVNVALPSIKHELGFSEQNLQWVVSGYVLTYGGFLLLGGRAADLVGRRRILVGGLILFALASLVAGAAHSDDLLIAARLAQGIGAAMMSPAALSILTTTFTNPRERNIALGAWAAIPGLAGASGVVLSGVLTQGPGWRWIFYLNLARRASSPESARSRSSPATAAEHKRSSFDLSGAVLVTAGMLLLIYVLDRGPQRRLGHDAHDRRARRGARHPRRLRRARASHPQPARPVLDLPHRGTRRRQPDPADHLQRPLLDVLLPQPLHAERPRLLADPDRPRLPAAHRRLHDRRRDRDAAACPASAPSHVIVAGALIAASGLYYLSHVPVDGTFLSDLLPGIGVVAIGAGAVFTGVTTAATDGVPPTRPASPPACSTPRCNSAARSASPSSPPSPPPAPTASSQAARTARSPSPPASNEPS